MLICMQWSYLWKVIFNYKVVFIKTIKYWLSIDWVLVQRTTSSQMLQRLWVLGPVVGPPEGLKGNCYHFSAFQTFSAPWCVLGLLQRDSLRELHSSLTLYLHLGCREPVVLNVVVLHIQRWWLVLCTVFQDKSTMKAFSELTLLHWFLRSYKEKSLFS